MQVERIVGPHAAVPFPVYPDLVAELLAGGDARNATVSHVLATCASYCYADLEALYVTGHSLGGAMAVLFALTTAHEELRGVYTFGQPMVVSGPVPERVAATIGRKIFRHVLVRDPVPALPPAGWGAYAHVGREYQYLLDH
jgi:alpha-beta hydrolase superfamily lysophospholipase